MLSEARSAVGPFSSASRHESILQSRPRFMQLIATSISFRDMEAKSDARWLGDRPEQLQSDGYCILPEVLSRSEAHACIEEWTAICQELLDDPAILKGEDGAVCGARDLLRLWPEVVRLVRHSRLRDLLLELLGPDAGLVRGLYFDKPPGRGWALPWHKDYNIAVRSHGRIGQFKKPTTKAGVPHVEAPESLLRRMVTVRIHLDEMNDNNGPLRVIPGSHLSDEVAESPARPPVVIHCQAGDAFLMRPLLTHASSHCVPDCNRHRRIVHLECAFEPVLPDGYQWRDFVRLL